MQYESVCVNIYDSQTTVHNKTIFFYTPIALLNPLNAVPIANQLTHTQGNLSIGFTIWNQTVTDKVAQHLNRVLGNQKVEANQVKVFPFDKVRLTSTKVQSDVDYSLTWEWQTFNTSRTSQRFSLTCPTREDCIRVRTRMHKNPQQFKHLRLEFYPQLNDGIGRPKDDNSISIGRIRCLICQILYFKGWKILVSMMEWVYPKRIYQNK